MDSVVKYASSSITLLTSIVTVTPHIVLEGDVRRMVGH